MAKKRVKKKTGTPKSSETRAIKQLVSTHASIQKISVSLISEMIKLSKRVDNLISIFEEASKHVGEVEVTDDRIKVLAGKLESLLEQNKELAKGLLLLEKYVRGRSEFESEFKEKPLGYKSF